MEDHPLLETLDQHINIVKQVLEPDYHEKLITEYLSQGVHVNTQLRGPNTPRGVISLLEVAIESGAVHCVEALLEAGADANFGGRCGRLPLLYACKQSGETGLRILKALLDNGALVNRKYVTGNTALLEAVIQQDVAKVQVLLEAGSDVCACNNGGDTALHLAAIRGNTRIIQVLLEQGLDVNITQSMGPSRMAVNILRSQGGGSPDDSSERPLGRSFIRNAGISPLHFTAYGPRGGHAEAADLLLKWGADPEASMENGRTTLHLCAMRNAHAVAKLLIDRGCKVDPISEENEERKTPLLKAVDGKHAAMVEVLLNAGADINFPDHWGLTPLMTAIFSDQVNIARILIQNGCDVNQKSKNGMSPLMTSLRRKDISFLQMLILAGCKLPHRSDHGFYMMENVDIFDNPNYGLLSTMTVEEKEWFNSVLLIPPKLSIICRNSTRHYLGNNVQSKIDLLPLPSALCRYLKFDELQDAGR